MVENQTEAQDKGAKVSTRRQRRRPRRLLFALDALSAAISVGMAFLIQRVRTGGVQGEIEVTTILALVIAVLTLGLLAWSGEYSKPQRVSRFSDAGALTRNLLISFGVASLANLATKGFFTGTTGPSRFTLGLFLVTLWLLGLIGRFVVSAYQRRLFSHGVGVRRVLVLGNGPEADEAMGFISSRPWLGVFVAGRLCLDDIVGSADDESLEGLRHLDETMRTLGAEEIIVALEPEDSGRLPQVTGLLTLGRMPYTVVPSLFEETILAGNQTDITPVRVLEMAVDPPDRLVRVVKRTSDVCIALVAMLLLALVTPPIALAIVIESGTPVFYSQERLGKYGKRFAIRKFRTMVVNADELLEGLKALNEADGPHFKMAVDPRLTHVGAFLRRWSLDEIPQFWNVLIGDMSVVGPRPPLPREVAQYDANQLVRLRGKPGITGLWQVSGRKTLTFDDMVRLDRYYLENWSLGLDVSIMLRTFSAVLARKGAY